MGHFEHNYAEQQGSNDACESESCGFSDTDSEVDNETETTNSWKNGR